jgi:hypothetical protein
MYLVVFYVGEYVWVCGCVYKIENFRTLSAPSEIASLREAISSSAAFELYNYIDSGLSMGSKTTRGSGWQHIRTTDEATYVMIFDIHILYEDNASLDGTSKRTEKERLRAGSVTQNKFKK